MESNYKNYKNFCHRFRAHVQPGKQKIRVVPAPRFDFNKRFTEDYFTTIDLDTVDISMPEEDFVKMINIIEEMEDPGSGWSDFQRMTKIFGVDWIHRIQTQESNRERERFLRDKNQALRNAWEQYQILLRLSGS